jgi:Co/Zn/Cd efflux system component
MSLEDEAPGREELRRNYEMGVIATLPPVSNREMLEAMNAFEASLASLVADGYVKEDQYRVSLTPKGSAAAVAARGRINQAVDHVSTGTHASAVSIIVNIVFAVVSLAAGVLSNSMGLISSGVDNTTSVATSAAAYAGIRFRRETLANAAIVVLGLALALILGYVSLGRLAHPQPVDAGLMAIAVAVFNGVVCYGLSLFQRFHAQRSGKFSLIILAVGNLGSVLISIAVLVGVLFARFGYPFVDSLVGLGIALVMLKCAVDLGRETLRIADGREPDIAQYELGIEKKMRDLRMNRFRFWILYQLREPRTAEELGDIFSERAPGGMQKIAALLRADQDITGRYSECLRELTESGLAVRNGDKYSLTAEGMRLVAEANAHLL